MWDEEKKKISFNEFIWEIEIFFLFFNVHEWGFISSKLKRSNSKHVDEMKKSVCLFFFLNNFSIFVF